MAQEHDWSSVGSPVEANSHDWSSVGDAVDASGKPKEIGGFKAAAKQTIGHSIKGIGQLASDYVGADQDNAVKRYGQSVVDANPTSVHGFGDIVDKPLTTIKEAVGNAAGSMAGIVGSGALGRGIAMIPHPVAKAVGAGIAAAGPIIAGALPSYSGIREAQINDNSGNESDATSKALALAGAGTVGLIESKFGPQEWALSAMTKAGRDKLAQKFGESFAKSVPGAIGKGALRGGAIEGAEELVQNPVEQLASYQNPTTAESLKDTAFGGVMGAIGGGVLGGGMAPIGMKYAESKRQPVAEQPAADQPAIAGLLPAPTYTGTPGDQIISNDAERQAVIDAADANAAAVYAARDAFEKQLRQSVTIINEPAPLQQRIDDMLGVDTSSMGKAERADYEKSLAAAFSEPIGIRHDANQREVPFTIGEYLDAQIAAENAAMARPLKQNAAQQADARLQQVADEEGYVAPEVPVVGTLSAVANMAIQSGAHKQNQMQQAMQAAVASQKTNNEGTANAAQAKPLAQEATRTNDAQAGLASSAAQAASQGTGVAAPAAFSASVPALNAGNSVNLPATSISSLQDQLDKTEPFSEQSQLLTERLQLAVTDDAKSAIGAGEMPVYKVTDHVSVAIHPSAQKEGMIQVTRYTKDGVIGDSQYNSIDEAVRFEGLTHKPRIPSNEAIAHIENSIAAEAEYQKRKNEQQAGAGLPASTAGGSRPAPVANQEPVKNQSEQPLDMVPAADAVSQPKNGDASQAVSAADRLGLKGADRKQYAIERLASRWGMTADEVAEDQSLAEALNKRPSKGDKTAANERFVDQLIQSAVNQSQPKTDTAPEARKGIRTIDKWTAAEIQARIDKGTLSPESEKKMRAELASRKPSVVSQEPELSAGKTPSSAEPITVRDGVVYLGKYPAADFETGEDVTVPDGASKQQIADALRKSGAIGQSKVFGLKNDAVPSPANAQAPAIAPQHVENGQAEPATAAVIEQSLKKGAANSPLDLREERDLLLKKVDAAIVAAPTAEEKGAWDRINKKIDLTNNMHVEDSIGYRGFDVPGDGKFKVLNLKEALQRFRERIEANPGFRKPTNDKPKLVADWQRTTAGGTEAMTKELLESGDYTAANEYAKQIGKPLVFAQYMDGSAIGVYTEAKPFEREGYDDFNMVSVRAFGANDKVAWAVVDLNSGLTVSSKHPSRMKAMIETNRALEKTTPANLATAVRSAMASNGAYPTGTQAELEQRWLANVEDREAQAQQKEEQEHRSKMRDAKGGMLAETSVGKDAAKKADDELAADIAAGVKNANDPERQSKVMADIEAKAAKQSPADLGGQSKKVNASDEINMGGKISPNAGASEQSTEVKEPWMMTLDEILPSDAEISDDGNTGFADSKLYDYGNPDMSKLSDIGGGYSVAPVKGRDSILLLLKGEYRIGVYTGEFGIKAAYRSKGLATKLVKEAMRRGIYTPDESYSVGGAKTVEKAHKEIIREAIADGKQIPDEVLADYPDLKESGIALLSPSLGRVNADKVDIAVASKVVADLLSGWRNAPDSRVVATFDDLPAAVRKEIEDQGEKTARGVFHGDTFYLIADEHASANEIEETIFHEVWAHYGLRSMLGANTTRELAGVFDQISASGIMGVNGKDAFRAFARRNGFNTAQTESMLRKAEAFDPRFTEAMKKRILVEELIAKVQEKGDNPSLKRKAQEIIGAIREWLRKVGFSGLMKYSDADLMRLVQKARDTVKYGKRGSSGKGDVPSVLMTAWHGSPHDHDKFDSSKIGTGEGAQAYGYGHYFAGAKDVAEWYRRKLSGADNSSITFNGKQYGDSDAANRKLTNDVKKWAEETGRDPERIDVALEYLAGMAGDLGSARQLAAKEGLGISHWIYGTLNDLSEHLYPSPNGRLYQVELAPTADEYLDWDKPLSEQSEFVRNALTDKSHFIGEYLSDTLEIAKNNGVDFNERGDTLYKIVSDQYGSDKAASDYLHSIGIRGIRYLDGSSRSAGEGNSNYVIFNDADVSITAKYNIASKDKLTPADKAIYGMAAEGKSAAEVLKFIASASRSPFNRQVAKLLLKTGIAPSVTVGDGKGWKMNAGEGNKYAAGYNPKTDTISLFRPASSERNMLHELIHAATLKALSKKGMASAQMNALYQHVKKSGKLKGMYGMSDVDEFIAEAFSNPKFQAALKQVAAPSTSTAKSAWHWFVRVIKGILGLPSGSENALSQALEIGIGVMRENMRLNEGAGDVRYNAAPGKINQTDTEAFKRWFGDSAVVDSDGKPLRVFHGTASDITAFDIGRSGESTGNTGFYGAGAYFSEDADYASGFSFWARRSDDQAPNVVPVYLSLKNPAYINITPRSQAASEKSRATAEKIISTMIARGTDKAVVDKLQGFVSENKFEPFMGTLYNALGGGTGTTALLKEAGFDGVTIYGGISGKEKLAEAVAFDPTQIKSAIGNSGDFDATNPDIRYNVADEGGDIGRIVGDSVSDQLKAAVLRLSGRPMLDHTDPFAAENARLREQDQSLWSKAKKQLRRYLAPGGLLPQSVFAEKIKRDSEFQAVEFDVRHLIGGLEQAVKADFGIAFDKLSKEQMRPITEALAGKVPASLPEATKTAAVAMRQYIDGMSTEYLKIIQQKIDAKMLKALESGKDSDKAQAINEIELFEKIKGNIGRYVHRSYQAFDDPKWFEKVPAHVLNASRLYLKQGYMEAGENDAKASQMAEVTLHEILKNGTAYDSMESFIAESKLGAKDLSVLMRRKEVPAQIRALLGEYPDARLNFTKSATKMGRLIWNTRFLDRVRDMGMGSFFFEGKDRPANATTQIAADGSEVYAPLNGLWTFPEIAQSFKDALGKEQMSDLYRAIVRANGLVKYGKTVLAPTTAMRNWQSAMFFSLANGHFDLTQMKKSISAFREQVSQKATGQDLKYLRHLKQLGVVYDTPYAGEMARLMEDARMEELLSSDKGDAVRWFRKANQLAQGFYTFGDDFWKIIGFENEKAGLMKAGLSLQEAETEAAKRIRDTYPTYSMVGRGIQWLSRFPLAGTFVSFPAEIIRTSGNMLRTVAADLKSDNPKLRELGMKRAAGMVFVSAAFYSLAALSMAMAGVGDDEDEAIRDLAPEWQKNSTFLYLGRDEKGNLRYFDMSFLDPYGYWKRPITAMLRNQPWEDSLASVLRGMLEPFIGADIAAKAIFEAVANQKENGGKVYKEKDGAINQTIDVADHLRKALQPGVVGNVERLVKAAGDVRKSSGQPYSMEDELVALVGWRATTIDPKTALYYRSFEFTDAVAEARKTITETLRDANEITPEDIADAKARAQAKQEQAFKEMHRLVSAAESAGMSKMQIVQTLRLSNISQANIGSLMRGETPDVSITPQLAARAVRQASQMRGPEYAAEVFDRYRQARAN